MPILQGALRGKKWIVGAGTHGCWLGSYEYNKRILFEKAVQPGMTVFDIGAHAGFYSLLASVLVGPGGRVVAFEPLPRNIKFLMEHLRLNRVHNVQVVEAAVADVDGVAPFDTGIGSSFGHLANQGQLEVRTVTLDSMIDRGRIPAPHVIKIDVEGAEYRLLTGAANTLNEHHPVLFLATHGKDQHGDCLGLLHECGYVITPVDEANVQTATELLCVKA